MRRAVPDVTHTTMGHENPNMHSRSDYQYRGRPGWPDDPGSRDGGGKVEPPKGGAVARKAERARRLAEFTALRAEGMDVTAAGALVGVAEKTAARYEQARLAALEGTPS